MAYTKEQRDRGLPAMEGPCCVAGCDQSRHVTKGGETKARCVVHWREQTAAMRKKAREAPTSEIRKCRECGVGFQWKSTHPKQVMCSKSCYMKRRELRRTEPRSPQYKSEVALRHRSKKNAAISGITVEEYNRRRMGACEICGADDRFPLNWDHDHRTGQFRGFLCEPCNHLLGKAKDDATILTAAIAYLQRR